MNRIFYIVLLSAAALLQGCSAGAGTAGVAGQPGALAVMSPTIAAIASRLAEQLQDNLRDDSLENWPCIVTTIVDIDNLEQSSRFGRTLAENLGSEIFRRGGHVFEIRAGNAFYIERGTGELVLSRDIDNLAKSMDARAVVTGTYSAGAVSVAVSIRLVDLSDRSVLSVAAAEIARTAAIESLLSNSGARPTAYDRMP